MLARWHAPLIIGIRFMYGFRVIGPVLLGMGRVSHGTFALYNAIGALIWAPLIAGLGFIFGEAMEQVLHDFKHYEKWGFALLLIGGLAFLLMHKVRERHLREKTAAEKGTDPG
jgi:membrane protein DedA with SNARE-associated domain